MVDFTANSTCVANGKKCSISQERYVAYFIGGGGENPIPSHPRDQVKDYVITSYALYCADNTKDEDPVPLRKTTKAIAPRARTLFRGSRQPMLMRFRRQTKGGAPFPRYIPGKFSG